MVAPIGVRQCTSVHSLCPAPIPTKNLKKEKYMITKQERTKLRSLAQTIEPTVWVGKNGFDESVIDQIKVELYSRELVKITLNPSQDKLTQDELSELATKTESDVVTQIGKKIVVYKPTTKKNVKHVLK